MKPDYARIAELERALWGRVYTRIPDSRCRRCRSRDAEPGETLAEVYRCHACGHVEADNPYART